MTTREPEVETLNFKQRLAERMGKPKGVARQRKQGKSEKKEGNDEEEKQDFGFYDDPIFNPIE